MHFNFRPRDAARMLTVAASLAAHDTPALADGDDDGGYRQGKPFISTNAPGWNALQVYARSASGPASLVASLPTGGADAGAGLGSQGAVTLGTSGRYLFGVNAGSNSLSTLDRWRRTQQQRCGLSQFAMSRACLPPLADGTRALGDGSLPAQARFDNEGDSLGIREQANNPFVSSGVRHSGALATSAAMVTTPGRAPFSFRISRRNVLVVSDAATSTASSLRIGERSEPALTITSPAVKAETVRLLKIYRLD